MKRFSFTKMVGSGNDFIVIDRKPVNNLPALTRSLCDRKFGIGADGLLLVDKVKKSMRIFNADGSEAQMCGNGARCVAFWFVAYCKSSVANLTIKTKAGLIKAQVNGSSVKIQLSNPKNIKLDSPLKVNGRLIKVNLINTGVPHAVIFVNDIDQIDVVNIGRTVRYHQVFSPAGTNVNFVEVVGTDFIRIRTYERGVEGETLACGTGSTASALIFALKNNLDKMIKVKTQSHEVLKVCFKKDADRFSQVWLQGSAKIVYKGEYYV